MISKFMGLQLSLLSLVASAGCLAAEGSNNKNGTEVTIAPAPSEGGASRVEVHSYRPASKKKSTQTVECPAASGEGDVLNSLAKRSGQSLSQFLKGKEEEAQKAISDAEAGDFMRSSKTQSMPEVKTHLHMQKLMSAFRAETSSACK